MDSIFDRTSEDILSLDVGIKGPSGVGPIPFTKPNDIHQVKGFFTNSARLYASGIRYTMEDLPDTRYAAFCLYGETVSHRACPWPDVVLGAEHRWPCPYGYLDQNGAGMTFPFTPIGYCLYYDRWEASNSFKKTAKMWHEDGAFNQLFPGYLKAGLLLNREKFRQGVESYGGLSSMIATDPPGVAAALAIMGKKYSDLPPDKKVTFTAIADQVDDFRLRWWRGEWYSHGNPSNTTRALRILFGL